MATKQQVERALAKIGGSLHDVGEGIYVIDSPEGMLWHTDTHAILSEYHPRDGSKADFWDDVLDDIAAGVTECDGWQDGIEAHGPCERCDHDAGGNRRQEWEATNMAPPR